MDGNNVKNEMTKMANSLVGYIALLRQLSSFCKDWVGDHSISIMASMNLRGWGAPAPRIYMYIYIVLTIYTLLDLAPPQTKFLGTPVDAATNQH